MMSAEMIRAYQAGRKGQTRRTRGLDVINESPDDWEFHRFVETGMRKRPFVMEREGARFVNRKDSRHEDARLPYGSAGNLLWFKETYAPMCREAEEICYSDAQEHIKEHHYIEYRADTGNPYPGDWPEEEARGNEDAPKWKSSMFMKRIYARYADIPILKVRVERLQSITASDALLEGIELPSITHPQTFKELSIWNFKELWNRINGKTLPWEKNPWVWVYEFPIYEVNK
jgi:hypothetical protein